MPHVADPHSLLPQDGREALTVGSWDWNVAEGRMTIDGAMAALFEVERDADDVVLLEALLDRIHPDDLPSVNQEVEAALASGGRLAIDYRVRRHDGGTTWIVAKGRCIVDAAGQPIRFVGVSYDIGARKAAQERLAALVALVDRLASGGDTADAAYAAAETIGRTLGVVRVGYGTINADDETIVSESEWVADGIAHFPPILHFRDHGSFIDDLKAGEIVVIEDVATDPRTAATAEATQALDVHALINLPIVESGKFVALLFVNDNRPRRWTHEEIAFVRSVAERARQAVERRRAEEELAALTARLEAEVEARTRDLVIAEESLRQAQKMEAVGQLTGGIAHDFNNLLTGITGAIEMMQVRIRQGRTTELDRYAHAAQGAAKRAAALTHRLLAFSRRQTLDPKPTDVNRLIQGIEELIRRTVGPQITVEFVGATGLWHTMVDGNQLENALLNLCINARDAMPDGGRITIETANKWLDERAGRMRDLDPGQYISLCVTDTGTGMPPEVQARAFDPFFTTKPMGEGTGLGLSMIYGFARQSGGQVRIYSEVGTGTTMCIYLPRLDQDAAPLVEDAASGEAIARVGPRRVLVVDDEPTIRMLVVEILGELGHTALEAGDGAAAMRILNSGAKVDLLITDVGLPGSMNGRQVADAALALLPRLKVLFITGYAENAVIGNRQLEPNMALVTKPFAMDVLAQRIAAILDEGDDGASGAKR